MMRRKLSVLCESDPIKGFTGFGGWLWGVAQALHPNQRLTKISYRNRTKGTSSAHEDQNKRRKKGRLCMKWTIKWLHSLKGVQINLSGIFSLADARVASSEVIKNTNWKNGDSILIDNTKLDMSGARSCDIESMTRMLEPLDAEIGMSKIAVVGSSDIQFGLARQFQILAEEHTSANIRPFRCASAAVDWITANFQPELCNVDPTSVSTCSRMLSVA